MSVFVIEGSAPLSGEITPQGAKNEALQLLCAVLLTQEVVTLDNVPDIQDVRYLIGLLKRLGVRVTRVSPNTYRFEAKDIDETVLRAPDFAEQITKLRGSVMLLGPLLARVGRAEIPKPGGDKVGRRRLDTHLRGFEQLGVRCTYEEAKRRYFLAAKGRIKGASVLLEEASVTGTANLIMVAVCAKGQTTLYPAAAEPYVQQLCHMLVSMGAHIEGIGTNRLVISGVESLGGCTHRLLADIIEVGSFIGLSALLRAPIRIKQANVAHFGLMPLLFERLGIALAYEQDDVYVVAPEKGYQVQSFIDGSLMHVNDGPWPALSPDLLSIGIVVATQAEGAILFHQRMFESRLFFVDKLIQMGANIVLCDPHRVVVIGSGFWRPLRGIRMSSPDIRAGIALLLAALSAKGQSIIENVEQIDRGYQHIEERLNRLGARISRKND